MFILLFCSIVDLELGKLLADRGSWSDFIGKALKIGLLITLVASTMYVIVWQIDYYFFIPDFYEKYSAHIIREMKASGATQAQIQQQMIANKSNGEMYRNPLFNAMYTYIEILPVGLIMSLLAAVILKRKSNPDNMIATASVG